MGDVTIDPEDTAVLFTDPRVAALKPEDVLWDTVRDLVGETDDVEEFAALQDAAREGNVPVFYSPHYYEDDEFET